MKWAEDTETGRTLTLPQLYRLREREIVSVFTARAAPRLIKAILSRNMVCLQCGNPVHAYASNRLNQFVLTGHDMTKAAYDALTQIGFSHYKPKNPRNTGPKPVSDCFLYRPFDPRFSSLAKESSKPDILKLVQEALCQRKQQERNRPVLWALHRAASLRYPDGGLYQGYLNIARNLFRMGEVLAHHPYILPYAVISSVPYFTRQGKYGPYEIRFAEVGRQELLYKDSKGRDRVALAPEYLTLQKRKGRGWENLHWDTRRFPVTETASNELARLELASAYPLGDARLMVPPSEQDTILVAVPRDKALTSVVAGYRQRGEATGLHHRP